MTHVPTQMTDERALTLTNDDADMTLALAPDEVTLDDASDSDVPPTAEDTPDRVLLDTAMDDALRDRLDDVPPRVLLDTAMDDDALSETDDDDAGDNELPTMLRTRALSARLPDDDDVSELDDSVSASPPSVNVDGSDTDAHDDSVSVGAHTTLLAFCAVRAPLVITSDVAFAMVRFETPASAPDQDHDASDIVDVGGSHSVEPDDSTSEPTAGMMEALTGEDA